MATIRDFEDILAWQAARELCNMVHNAIDNRPWHELAGIKDQIYKSSGSVMDNIAEGFDRDSNPEFLYFLAISKASCAEVRSQVHRLYDYELINEKVYTELLTSCRKTSSLIGAFMQRIKHSGMIGNRRK